MFVCKCVCDSGSAILCVNQAGIVKVSTVWKTYVSVIKNDLYKNQPSAIWNRTSMIPYCMYIRT